MSDVHAAVARLERAQRAVSDVLMPNAAEWTPPGERYARALDLVRLGVADALVMLRRVAEQAPPSESSLIHFRLSHGEIVCGAADPPPPTSVPSRVTCPACREWIEQNLAVPEPKPADGDEMNRADERGGEDHR